MNNLSLLQTENSSPLRWYFIIIFKVKNCQ